MMVNFSRPYPTISIYTRAKSSRYLIAGGENTVDLGDLIEHFLSMKKYHVDQITSYDADKKVILCELGIRTVSVPPKISFGIDTMVSLNDESLDYETLVSKNGKLVMDGSIVTRDPMRSDLYQVLVPTAMITSRIRQGWKGELDTYNLATMTMFGSLMAIQEEYLDAVLLSHLVKKKIIYDPSPPYIMAAYSGYDWIREQELRNKSPVRSWPIAIV